MVNQNMKYYFKSLVKNYQGQYLSSQGSVQSTDLHALDSNKRHIFHSGVREKRLFHNLLKFFLMLVLLVGCGSSEENNNSDVNISPDLKSESINKNNAFEEKTDKEESDIKVTFIELGSVNCIPCRMMQPIMKEVEEEYKNQVKVVFHDVWTEQGRPYAIQYGIRVIPTQVFLDKDGKEYFRHEGFFPKEELVEILKKQGVN